MKWLVGGKVYDVEQGVFTDHAIVVNNGGIAALESKTSPGPNDEVVDLSGSYVLPGLIDCHVHLTLNPDAGDPSAYGERSLEKIRADTLAAAQADPARGYYDGARLWRMGTTSRCRFEMRWQAGRAPGPRMLLSGKLIWVDTPAAADYLGMFEVARNAEELKTAASRQLEHGADFIKVMATGLTMSSENEAADDNYYTAEELRVLVDFAHGKNVKVACHAEGLEGMRNVVAAGTDSVEHGTQAVEDVLRVMAKKTYLPGPDLPGHVVLPRCSRVKGERAGLSHRTVPRYQADSLQSDQHRLPTQRADCHGDGCRRSGCLPWSKCRGDCAHGARYRDGR